MKVIDFAQEFSKNYESCEIYFFLIMKFLKTMKFSKNYFNLIFFNKNSNFTSC